MPVVLTCGETLFAELPRELGARLDDVRARIADELDLRLPPIKAAADPALPPAAFRVWAAGREVGGGEPPAEHRLPALVETLEACIRASAPALYRATGDAPLVVQVGPELRPLVDNRHGARLLGRLRAIQERWEREGRGPLPSFLARDDARLPARGVRFLVGGALVWQAELADQGPLDWRELATDLEAQLIEALLHVPRRLAELN